MNAIILASGKGTRMLPWTQHKNKCMFKVNGKPLLLYHIEQLKRIGVNNIIVTVHWQAEEIIKASIKWGYKNVPEFFEEKQLSGSGTAVSEIMERYNLDRTIVIYGDTWFEPEFYKLALIDDYDSDKNIIFVDSEHESNKGFVYFDINTMKVKKILENKNKNYSSETICRSINMGALLLKKLSSNGDLMKNCLPLLQEIYVYDNDHKWVDIGEIDRYIKLTLELYDSLAVRTLIYLHPEKIIEFTKKILYADRIFICGNGGSLSTAEHLALDFSKVGGKNAIALNSAPVMTAYGNDESFENIFIRQLRCFNIGEKDVILLLSGSGNSKNIVSVAKQYPDNVIAMSGQSGYLIENVKLTLSAPSSNIRVIEDIHLAYGHAITEVMEGLV